MRIFTANNIYRFNKMPKYIHQIPDWPNFTWDKLLVSNILAEVKKLQGLILGKMEMVGFELQQEAVLETFTNDILKSSEIEGEILNLEQVRSSIAKKLGIELGGYVKSNKHIDGFVEILIDATKNCQLPISKERLFNWHAALFPTGKAGMYPIIVGNWRKNEMQVVSGAMGNERVHFEAVEVKKLEFEMDNFIKWFNKKDEIDAIIKAGIAHLWFLTIHPFDDGNGRIGRVIMDMQLAKADGVNIRYYSISSEIQKQSKGYYSILENSQKGSLDITKWLVWYLICLKLAIETSDITFKKIISKAKFWERIKNLTINDRQKFMLNKILDNFEGKLTSSKWAKMNKCSSDTALRDIQNLIEKGILKKEMEGGRSTNYELVW